MCYPFGSYNADTLSILADLNIDYSLTANVGPVSIKNEFSIHELSRWDTIIVGIMNIENWSFRKIVIFKLSFHIKSQSALNPVALHLFY